MKIISLNAYTTNIAETMNGYTGAALPIHMCMCEESNRSQSWKHANAVTTCLLTNIDSVKHE